MKTADLKIYAYYLPQFHETQENNIWWGKGFTEWDNVRGALPACPGHYQPRVPLANKYYDLSRPEAIAEQAELARAHGVDGFGIYHYWYSGVRLLSKPIDLILANKWIDTNFYLCWANHSWTRSWKNNDASRDILIQQNYEKSPRDIERHYDYLARAMSDPRYVTIAGKYLLQIYQPATIPDFFGFVDGLRKYVRAKLGGEIHVSGMISHTPPSMDFLGAVDSVTLFQPGAAIFNTSNLSHQFGVSEAGAWLSAFVRNLPAPLKAPLYSLQKICGETPTYFSYADYWAKILNQSQCLNYCGKELLAGAFVDFDNTARYGNRAKIFTGVSPDIFERNLLQLARLVKARFENKIILINAWNEWGEGAYLEPDSKRGHAYLEAIRKVVNDVNS